MKDQCKFPRGRFVLTDFLFRQLIKFIESPRQTKVDFVVLTSSKYVIFFALVGLINLIFLLAHLEKHKITNRYHFETNYEGLFTFPNTGF